MSEVSVAQINVNLTSDLPDAKKSCNTETVVLPATEASISKEVESKKKASESAYDPLLLIDATNINELPKKIQEYASNPQVKYHLKGKMLELQAKACMGLIESEYTTVKNCVRLLKILRNEDWSYQTPLLPVCTLDIPSSSSILTQADNNSKSKHHAILTEKPETTKTALNSAVSLIPIEQLTNKISAQEELLTESSKDFKIPANPAQQVNNLSYLPLALEAEELIVNVQKTLDNSHHTIALLQKTRQLLIRQSTKNRRLYSDLKRARKLPDPVVNGPPAKKSKKRS